MVSRDIQLFNETSEGEGLMLISIECNALQSLKVLGERFLTRTLAANRQEVDAMTYQPSCTFHFQNVWGNLACGGNSNNKIFLRRQPKQKDFETGKQEYCGRCTQRPTCLFNVSIEMGLQPAGF